VPLKGQVSGRSGLADGVLVAATNHSLKLRGLSPQSGRQLWEITLAGKCPRPGEYNDEAWSPKNPVSWWHIDPANGKKLAEYPVAELACVELHGKYFCAFGSSRENAWPVVYDTQTRKRIA
jgi:hypothetical protein